MTPGGRIGYTVTWLEMTGRPPAIPAMPEHTRIVAAEPSVETFLRFYRGVGAPYQWTDWLTAERAELEAFVMEARRPLFILTDGDEEAGFYMLDTTEPGVTDIAYFGLLPQAVGRGYGFAFLMQAVGAAWDVPGTKTVTVNTCTLDHPAALPTYRKAGFVPVRSEERTRTILDLADVQ